MLGNVGLDQYCDVFLRGGFDSMEALAAIRNEDFERFGLGGAEQARVGHAVENGAGTCSYSRGAPRQLLPSLSLTQLLSLEPKIRLAFGTPVDSQLTATRRLSNAAGAWRSSMAGSP